MYAVCFSTSRREKRRIARQQHRPIRSIVHVEQWIIGAYDRVEDRVYLQTLQRGRQARTTQAAEEFWTRCICPLSLVLTDSARIYRTRWIETHLMRHMSVNHNQRPPQRVLPSVQTMDGVALGTQRIEQEWNQLRDFARTWKIEKRNLLPEPLQQYLEEFMFRRNTGIFNTPQRAFEFVCRALHAHR